MLIGPYKSHHHDDTYPSVSDRTFLDRLRSRYYSLLQWCLRRPFIVAAAEVIPTFCPFLFFILSFLSTLTVIPNSSSTLTQHSRSMYTCSSSSAHSFTFVAFIFSFDFCWLSIISMLSIMPH
ncbi:hypothetical protein BCR43DRAFT_119365 [Syncephalastrum racemosum]|uniref:Uncharacterized protein n=1 Tax=Syncephalastrum racemosum TaxID=13706 RepID=A0A1X2GZJ4_SYNRA|nr:hypothetical protein BCR43DRAFT_119365 [Syncephalastrum racemosum]